MREIRLTCVSSFHNSRYYSKWYSRDDFPITFERAWFGEKGDNVTLSRFHAFWIIARMKFNGIRIICNVRVFRYALLANFFKLYVSSALELNLLHIYVFLESRSGDLREIGSIKRTCPPNEFDILFSNWCNKVYAFQDCAALQPSSSRLTIFIFYVTLRCASDSARWYNDDEESRRARNTRPYFVINRYVYSGPDWRMRNCVDAVACVAREPTKRARATVIAGKANSSFIWQMALKIFPRADDRVQWTLAATVVAKPIRACIDIRITEIYIKKKKKLYDATLVNSAKYFDTENLTRCGFRRVICDLEARCFEPIVSSRGTSRDAEQISSRWKKKRWKLFLK